MIRLLVHGAAGRMGRRICDLALRDSRFKLVAGIDMDGESGAGAPERVEFDAVIDFSSDQGAQRACDLARTNGAALLIGTTGLSAQTLEMTRVCAQSAPVMIAPNTSLGIAVVNHLVAEAARLLGSEFDLDIVDVHHNQKRDAPSGTALRLAKTLRELGANLPDDRIHSVRAGDVVGDHSVEFSGPGERIKIFHSATNRDVFALGALRAIAWLAGREPGLYTIEDSLGLTKSR